MKAIFSDQPIQTTSRVIFGALAFLLIMSLACSAPVSDPNSAATQAALELRSTELSLKETQMAQAAAQQQSQSGQENVQPPTENPVDLQATQAAQQATINAMNATQIAISVQQTSAAAGGTGNAAQPPTPTQGTTLQALPGFSNFTDNFIDPTSGWPIQSTGISQWWYGTDHYYIHVGSSNTQAVVTPGYSLADGYVMASGTITQDQPHAYYGVVCRYQDPDNYYFFEVAFDGYYQIGKRWNGQWQLIGMGESKYSNAVNMIGYNQIAGHCYSNELTLYVNDIYVETVYDNTFTSGQVGLSASVRGFPGMTAAFDFFIAEE